MNRFAPALLAGLLVAVLAHAAPASAQTPEQQILELNGRAMEAYMNLDLEQAKKLLTEALRLAERSGVSGRPLARTYVNLGVISVGGEKDQASGFEFFKAALEADPTVHPDPATSTPEVEEAFELAQGRYAMETGHALPSGDTGPTAGAAGEQPEEAPAEEAERPAGAAVDQRFGERRRGFIHLGFSVGAVTVGRGKPADPFNPALVCDDMGNCQLPASYVSPGNGECDGNDLCVRVEQPGMLPTFGLAAAVGYYVVPHFALALTARFGFGGGDSTLSQLMFGARAQYAFIEPDPTGLGLAAFVGGAVGQIQTQPDQGGEPEPYVRSGLGSVEVGAVIDYRFLPAFGIQVTPQLDVFFPTTAVAIEAQIGIEIAL